MKYIYSHSLYTAQFSHKNSKDESLAGDATLYSFMFH